MLTVVFTTFNGQDRLRRTLDSLVNQRIKSEWELIIINNNSNDKTLYILEEYKGILPLKILDEIRQGKNIALNSAIPFMNGDFILFTDDDVRGDEFWLENAIAVASENKDFSIFAGVILPEWEVKPPSWLLDWAPLGALYALNSEYVSNKECSPGKVWGPNMLIRREVIFENKLYFNEKIGPNGTDYYPMGSETEFTRRASELGYRCFISNKFKVYHWIPKRSLNKLWIFKRAERLGIGVTMARLKGINTRSYFEFIVKTLFYTTLSTACSSLWNKKVFWLFYKKSYYLGCLKAARKKLKENHY